MTPDAVRRLALSLPGATEQPHFEMTSFRVGTKIFATLPPDQAAVHVFVAEEDARAAAQEAPDLVELLWWGRRLSGVRARLATNGDQVDDDQAADRLLVELIEDAWRRKAPRKVVAAYDEGAGGGG